MLHHKNFMNRQRNGCAKLRRPKPGGHLTFTNQVVRIRRYVRPVLQATCTSYRSPRSATLRYIRLHACTALLQRPARCEVARVAAALASLSMRTDPPSSASERGNGRPSRHTRLGNGRARDRAPNRDTIDVEEPFCYSARPSADKWARDLRRVSTKGPGD